MALHERVECASNVLAALLDLAVFHKPLLAGHDPSVT